jgi:hypothetical protein
MIDYAENYRIGLRVDHRETSPVCEPILPIARSCPAVTAQAHQD